MRVLVHACTQQIANTCGCSSSPPLNDVMIFQGPPFAFHVHDKRLYCSMNNDRWRCRRCLSDICNVIQLRLAKRWTFSCCNIALTHWGRVTHIHVCVGKLTIIGWDNGLSPGRRQAIIWTNAGILLIRPLGTNFSEILIGIQTFSFKKMYLKMSSAIWRPFCLGLNVLIILVALVNFGPTVVVVNLWSEWLEIYTITFFIISVRNKHVMLNFG